MRSTATFRLALPIDFVGILHPLSVWLLNRLGSIDVGYGHGQVGCQRTPFLEGERVSQFGTLSHRHHQPFPHGVEKFIWRFHYAFPLLKDRELGLAHFPPQHCEGCGQYLKIQSGKENTPPFFDLFSAILLRRQFIKR